MENAFEIDGPPAPCYARRLVDVSIAKLPELGQIENQLETLKRRLEAIPLQRHSDEAELAKLEATLKDEKEKVTALEKERRAEEKDLADKMEHIRQRETRLMEIKTNKEYRAAVKEVETAKAVITQEEDKILELMVSIETHTKLLQEAEKRFQDEASQIKTRIEASNQEESSLEGRIRELEKGRDGVAASLTHETQALIERARRVRPPPLAEVLGEICQACHINIPPQLFIEIRKLERVVPCPSCHRILYFDPTRQGPTPSPE